MGKVWQLFFAAALVTLVKGYLCPYEVCVCSSYNKKNIDCRNKGLTALPPLKKGNFTQTRLDISDNNITSIADGQLPRGLVRFTSHNTPLAAIADNAFNGSSSTLLELDVQYSQLKGVPWELMDLPHLTTLLWCGNPTTSWHPYEMTTLGHSVESLTLDHAGMTTIPDWIGRFTKLKTFNFRYNNMTDLGLTSLLSLNGDNSFPLLETIDLSHNLIDDLNDFNLFRFSKHLNRIILSNNKIRNIDVLINLDSIGYLDVSYNMINDATRIAIALYPHRESLTSLRITNNLLTQIPDLSHMTKLQTLDLYNNQIIDSANVSLPDSLDYLRLISNSLTEIPRAVSGLSRLTKLDLDSNKIHSIDSFTFPSSLKTLDLRNNQIENISSAISFSQNSSDLLGLYLDHNPLTQIANDAFTRLSNLTNLNLYATRLTRLPLALRSLTHLTTLALEDIPTLKCTCEEAALVPWYKRLTSLTIWPGSYCDGSHDVDFFLDQLAQTCPAT